jgi:glutamate dehydrogenase
MRLVDDELAISHFCKTKLSPHGEIFFVDNEEGINKRNSMHNRLVTDAFIPAGGRPGTIDMTNYTKFLKEDGTSTSPVIVEGANLFITGDAREALYNEAGVVIVKDSSANKCGVITSSFEICAAMLLTDEEFFEHKDAIVNEVIEKLRDVAKMEAELLFKEWDIHKGKNRSFTTQASISFPSSNFDHSGFSVPLPEVSQRISNSINNTTDALVEALAIVPESTVDELLPLFKDHLPKTLANLGFDRVKGSVPDQYIINAIASCLASKIVYKGEKKLKICFRKNIIIS